MSESAERLRQLSPEQRAAIAARIAQERRGSAERVRPRDPALTELPASYAQQRLWFLDQWAPGRPIYNIPFRLRIRGALDVSALQAALSEIVRRHEVLRTALVDRDGVPVQVVRAAEPFPLEVRDVRPGHVDRIAAKEAAAPFDLAGDPLLRGRLLRLSEQEHVLLLTMHHIASDGWSVGLLSDELAALYGAFSQGRPSPLPPLEVQYGDFAIWQLDWMQRGEMARQLGYWTEQLRDLPTLELPTDRPRPDHPPYRGERLEHPLPPDLVPALDRFSDRHGVTLFMSTLAAFAILLHRYTGQDEVVVGSAFASRGRTEVEPLMGLFANMLVLRNPVSGDETFLDVLARARETVLGAGEHQEIPFERLVEALQPERDRTRNPLFQVSFTLQNSTGGGFSLPGLEVAEEPVDSGTSRFDMAFNVEERATGWQLWADYSTELWDAERIRRMFGHYETLLRAVLERPDALVRDLPVMTEAEYRELVLDFNDTRRGFDEAATLDGLIEAQADARPDHPAVRMDGREISYRELDERANGLAAALGELRAGDEIVGICLDRSVDLPVSMLAVQKAGAAYLPLDPTDPPARRDHMLADAGVATVIVHDAAALELPAGVRAIDVRAVAPSSERPPRRHGAGDPAYVIFTSGSTGAPKGVVVEHRAAVNFVTQTTRLFGLGDEDRMLQFANPTFDVSVFEVFACLTSGGTLCLADRDTLLSPDRLVGFLQAERITVMDMAPAVMALLPADRFPSLRIAFVGGEAFPAALVHAWNLPGRRFFNGYGPTEATVTCIVHECRGRYDASPPIGRPLGNYRAYVLDRYGNPLPAGMPGELYLGGAGLARGYLNRPELTAERFPPDRVLGDGRTYRTGDLVRQDWDGELVFLGRVDRQVKLRGLRIELGEIETALAAHPAVRQAVVQVAGEGSARRLVAFVVPDGDCDAATLREHLADRLPRHMTPAQFAWLEALPLNASGKVDYARLPAPDAAASRDTAYVAPRSETERLLAEDIVGGMLEVQDIGAEDNFFALGGNSLQATQLVARIRSAFDADLKLQEVYSAASIAELAQLIEDARGGGGAAAVDEDEELRRALEAEVESLSDEEVAALLREEAGEEQR